MEKTGTKQQSTTLAMINNALFYCAVVAAPCLLQFLVHSNSLVELYQFCSGLWNVNLNCSALLQEFSFAVIYVNRAVCREKLYPSMQRPSSESRYENLGELLPRKTSGSLVDTQKFSYIYGADETRFRNYFCRNFTICGATRSGVSTCT